MITKTLSAAAFVLTLLAVPATAEEARSVDETYKEIEATFGVVPGFLKGYPKSGVTGAWTVLRDFELSDKTALSPKMKALISVAVAAQIPCRYCIWLDSKSAKALGATDDEFAEAVTQGGVTRHWSAVINGLQIDFDEIKSEFGGD